jgi:uncharacterized membrane protein YhaH (DUF805 family)
MGWFTFVMRKYFVIDGRASRTEYWMFYLLCIVTYFGLGILTALGGEWLSGLFGIINLIFALVTLIPTVTCGIRRMHDIGRSGWWLIVPIVGFIFLVLQGNESDNEYGPVPPSSI